MHPCCPLLLGTALLLTLSVMMPHSDALESVSSAASTRLADMLWHTVVTLWLTDTVRALDSRSRFTVRSPMDLEGQQCGHK